MNLSELALRPGQDPARAARPAFLTVRGPVSNAADFAAAFLAAIWIGAIPVLQNSQFGRSELEHIIALCEPRALLVSENFAGDPATAGLLPHALRLVVESVGRCDSSSGSIAESIAVPAPFDSQRDAPAFIVFTSGTTGEPKGVIHAHRWLDALGDSNRARVPPRPDDVVLATGEWSFISALGHNVLFPLRNGVAGSIMEGCPPPASIPQTFDRDRVICLYTFAPLYRRILAIPRLEQRYDLHSLLGANSTGEPLEDSVRDKWESRIGCPIWEHYGILEAQ